MPKKIKQEEEFEEDFDEDLEEDLDEDEEELEEETESIKRAVGRPKGTKKKDLKKASAEEEDEDTVKRRYAPFAQQASEGIADAESGEVLATNIWQALADIIERLERIENSLGNLLEG